MYDGVGIANVVGRTVEIGAEGGDTIEMVGWFACNGNASTPNLLDIFIRGFSSSGGFFGNNDSIVVQHNHGASSGSQSVSHTHTIGNQTVSHTHTIDSGGSHSHRMNKSDELKGDTTPRSEIRTAGTMSDVNMEVDGDHQHTQGNQSAAHSHTPGSQSASHSHGITVNNEGVSGVNANIPRHYRVIYIIRMS